MLIQLDHRSFDKLWQKSVNLIGSSIVIYLTIV